METEPVMAPSAVAGPRANQAENVERTGDEIELLKSLKTVVINLDRRSDRLQSLRNRFGEMCPELELQVISAVDGRSSKIEADLVTESWDTTHNAVYVRRRYGSWCTCAYEERILELSPGERGCAASHIKVWKSFVASGSEGPLLVLEDDASPKANFIGVLSRALEALPMDADLLYLGYDQACDWRREVSPELAESEYVWTTVGYMVWPATAERLLSKLPINQPVDNWLALMSARCELKAYCVRPQIICQAQHWNIDSDVPHSDESPAQTEPAVAPAPVADLGANKTTEVALPSSSNSYAAFWDSLLKNSKD